jgi:hypothetical protein
MGELSGTPDPRRRWRELPARSEPETWIIERAVVAVPGSVARVESDLQAMEARYLIERGCGLF